MRVIKAPFRPRGGVHPKYFKDLTAGKPVRNMPLPSLLRVAMTQHLGAPALPVVKKGDAVTRGQLIGKPNGFVSAAIHSPASGTIKALEDASGLTGRAVNTIVIGTGESDLPEQMLEPIVHWENAPSQQLLERVSAAGIVGMGGAGFPTHVKLAPPSDKKIDTLIVNGAECEPYLTADYRLMLENPQSVWGGAQIIARILGVEQIAIAVEDNKPEAIRNLAQALKKAPDNVKIVVLATYYPQGAEKQQIYAVTGRETPSGKLPMDVGCLVENAGTCVAIYEAVAKGLPLLERLVTVTGSLLRDPQNVKAAVGTSIADLVEFCGGLKGNPGKVICGGPMMGLAQSDLEAGITKTTSGLLFLQREAVTQFSSMPCISCGRCVAACPMGLMPNELSELVETEAFDLLEDNNMLDCIECGSCAHECPAHRPLVQQLRRGKAEVTARRRARQAAASKT